MPDPVDGENVGIASLRQARFRRTLVTPFSRNLPERDVVVLTF